jgi:prepilin-type N-terminal cleavage/methylation domain-containing protein
MPTRAEQGFTLIEVSIVTALAALVVMGLLTFYMNSQATWIAGSTQAMAQRDGTLLVETLSDSVRAAYSGEVYDSPDSLHQGLILRNAGGDETWRFWWDATDSLVHWGPGFNRDLGPVVASRVTRIQLAAYPRLVEIRLAELRSGDGQLVRTASAAAFRNYPPPQP